MNLFEVRQTAVFAKWLAELKDRRARTIVVSRISRIEIGAFGDVKAVGEGVSELRIDFGPGYRVYFIRRDRVVVILLCGGDKGSQRRDIETAKAMSRED